MRNKRALAVEHEVLKAMFNPSSPMTTVYGVCERLGVPQRSSTHAQYAMIYRAMERLVDQGKVQVMRGTRDVSVYLSMNNVIVTE